MYLYTPQLPITPSPPLYCNLTLCLECSHACPAQNTRKPA